MNYVIQFSDWAVPIVAVLKNDQTIRICGDFKQTINQASKLDRYPIPKIEYLFATLGGERIFSKLDLRQAYLQIPLDDESKMLAVINTHRGLYKHNRLWCFLCSRHFPESNGKCPAGNPRSGGVFTV